MCNSSFCKCIGLFLSVIAGMGAGFLFGTGFLYSAVCFAIPFILVFAAIVILSILFLFARTACEHHECHELRKKLCADRNFTLASAIATLIFGLITVSIVPYCFISFILQTIFFGITFFFFVLTLVGLFCLIKSFCERRRCKCECECRCHESFDDREPCETSEF